MSVLKMSQDNQLREYLDEFVKEEDAFSGRRSLARALHALEDPKPPKGGWQALQHTLQRQAGAESSPRPRREPNWFLAGIGVAATVILSIGLVMRFLGPDATPGGIDPGMAPSVSTAPLSAPNAQMTDRNGSAQVASLMRYSRQQEAQLRALRERGTPRVMSGSEAATVDELERMIGLVDLQLAAAPTTEAEREALWRKRVALMNQLLQTQASPASMEL